MLVFTIAFGLALLLAPGAQAEIRIRRINFDPVGYDSGSNQSLNREYIVVTNAGTSARRLTGWILVDGNRDNRYTFPRLRLEPGAAVRVRSGRGADTVHSSGDHDYYWNLNRYVWDNTGDSARLLRRPGVLVDRCRYTASQGSPVRC